jgi:Domain of unknown function (DUF4070)
VDFVDDNLIGNKKAVKAFLPHLKTWLEQYDYPFEFSTEASINLSDDEELLRLMQEANFFAIFVGIESPDEETLKQMRKKQNTRRGIAESIHRIYAHGIFVTGGFIVGFDSEKGSVSRPMVDLIEECAIPVGMVGLLYGLTNTQLGRRLMKEGRLHPNSDRQTRGDQCTAGLNFETIRARKDILTDYRNVLEEVFDPVNFAGRIKRLAGLLDRSKSRRDAPKGDVKMRAGTTQTLYQIVNKLPEARATLWEAFTHVARTNPAALRFMVQLMALYLHVGPFSRQVMADIDRQIAELDIPGRPNSRLPVHLERAVAPA